MAQQGECSTVALTDAQIAADIGNMFTDLSATGANESATLTPASGADDSTFDVIRAKALTARDLAETGWANKYSLSVYALQSTGNTAAKGDIVTMTREGELRILRVAPGPAIGYIRLDLGDPYSGGV